MELYMAEGDSWKLEDFYRGRVKDALLLVFTFIQSGTWFNPEFNLNTTPLAP